MNYANPLLIRQVANGFIVTEWERPDVATSDDQTHVFPNIPALAAFLDGHFATATPTTRPEQPRQ